MKRINFVFFFLFCLVSLVPIICRLRDHKANEAFYVVRKTYLFLRECLCSVAVLSLPFWFEFQSLNNTELVQVTFNDKTQSSHQLEQGKFDGTKNVTEKQTNCDQLMYFHTYLANKPQQYSSFHRNYFQLSHLYGSFVSFPRYFFSSYFEMHSNDFCLDENTINSKSNRSSLDSFHFSLSLSISIFTANDRRR